MREYRIQETESESDRVPHHSVVGRNQGARMSWERRSPDRQSRARDLVAHSACRLFHFPLESLHINGRRSSMAILSRTIHIPLFLPIRGEPLGHICEILAGGGWRRGWTSRTKPSFAAVPVPDGLAAPSPLPGSWKTDWAGNWNRRQKNNLYPISPISDFQTVRALDHRALQRLALQCYGITDSVVRSRCMDYRHENHQQKSLNKSYSPKEQIKMKRWIIVQLAIIVTVSLSTSPSAGSPKSISPLFDGGIIDFDVADEDSNKVILLVNDGENSLIYTTDNGGLSWMNYTVGPVLDKYYTGISFTQNDGVILIFSGDRIYRSSNGGEIFSPAVTPEGMETIRQYLPNPADPDLGFAIGSRSIYRTIDSGRTWVSGSSVASASDLGIEIESWCFSHNGKYLFLAGLYTLLRSDDQGEQFQQLDLPLKDNNSVAVISDPSGPNSVLLMLNSHPPCLGNMYSSADAGATWQKISNFIPYRRDWTAWSNFRDYDDHDLFAVIPGNPKQFVSCFFMGYLQLSSSKDGGLTWESGTFLISGSDYRHYPKLRLVGETIRVLFLDDDTRGILWKYEAPLTDSVNAGFDADGNHLIDHRDLLIFKKAWHQELE